MRCDRITVGALRPGALDSHARLTPLRAGHGGHVMQTGALGPLLARDVLAVAFLLTATWKVSHPREYAATYARMRPAFARGIDAPARAAIVVTEFLCA